MIGRAALVALLALAGCAERPAGGAGAGTPGAPPAAGSGAAATPWCADVGGYAAYLRRTGEICRVDHPGSFRRFGPP